jgi:hypothetical protein
MTNVLLTTLLAVTLVAGEGAPADKDVVILGDYAPCGIVSLYLIAKIREVPAEWEQVKTLVGPHGPDQTHSFADLSRAATQLGMHPVGLQVRREALKDLPLPAILQVRDSARPDESPHLLVLLRLEADGVTLLDAPYPPYFLPESQFASTWTGNVLVFAHSEGDAGQLRAAAQEPAWMRLALWVWVGAGGVLLICLLAGSVWLRRAIPSLPGVVRFPPRRWQAATAVVASVALVGTLSVLYFSRPAGQPTPPRCAFDSAVHDLGELAPGATTVRVRITNAGDAPLSITDVRSTCSCAVVTAPELISAREQGVMEVALSVSPGPGKARLTVESNDPEGPKSLVLAWRGTAQPRLAPGWVAATSVPTDRAYQRTLKLIYPGGKSAIAPRLERCECASPRVQTREGKNDPMAVQYGVGGQLVGVSGELELYLTVQPPPAPELFQTQCKLVLDYGPTPTTLEFPVTVDFTGGELTPDVRSVVFSAGSAGALVGQEREVRVARRDRGEIEVRDLPSWLDGRVVSTTETECVVRLRVAAPPPAKLLVQHTLHLGWPGDSRSQVPLQVSAVALQR